MLKIKKIKPLFDTIVTTMDKYDEDIVENGLIKVNKKEGTIKEFQKVVAVGSTVRDIEVGDIVCINPRNYAVKKYQDGSLKDGVIMQNPVVTYNFNVVEIDAKPHLQLTSRDIDYVVLESEEVEEGIVEVIPNKIIL